MSKGVAINSFMGGLVSDLNAITTPNSVLTYALNCTGITFNGNELVLQNDMGNTDLTDIVSGEDKVALSQGFVPVGIKDYGGIIYIVSVNSSGETEIGSFPSPDYNPAIQNTDEPKESVIYEKTVGVTTNNIGKTVELSTDILSVGDPFMIDLEMDDREKSLLTNLNNERKFYIPKLVSIDKYGVELDITDKVSKQLYYDESTDNFWFRANPNKDNESFIDYVNKGLVQRYKNIRSGKLGVKFILEDIDLFHITADSNDNFFPVLSYDDVLDSYKLTFASFQVKEGSLFKCNNINIIYSIYDNTNLSLIDDKKEIENNNTPVLSNTAERIIITDNFSIVLTKKNVTIDYKIIPSDTRYAREFTNYIISNRLDLSKSSTTWALKPYWDIIESISYCEKSIGESDTAYVSFSHNQNTPSNILTTNKINLYDILPDREIIITVPNFSITTNVSFIDPLVNGNPSSVPVGLYANFTITISLYKELVATGEAIIIGSVNQTIHDETIYYTNNSPQSITHTAIGQEFNSIIPENLYKYYVKISFTMVTYNIGSSEDHTVSNPTYNINFNTNNINYSYKNMTGYQKYPVIGRFGTVNGIATPLDIDDNVLGELDRQAVYILDGYSTNEYDSNDNYPHNVGTFTIDTYNKAICSPLIPTEITVKKYNTTLCPISWN